MKRIKPSVIFAKQERLAWLEQKVQSYLSEAEEIREELSGLDVAKVLQAEIQRNQELLAMLKQS